MVGVTILRGVDACSMFNSTQPSPACTAEFATTRPHLTSSFSRELVPGSTSLLKECTCTVQGSDC
jgi:hypothetical protein